MVKKEFGKDFYSRGGALTLSIDEVSEDGNVERGEVYERTHADGWTIEGAVHEDYFQWVNNFEASHPIHGRVYGDFEDVVYADSEEGYEDFYKGHKPEAWDYDEI